MKKEIILKKKLLPFKRHIYQNGKAENMPVVAGRLVIDILKKAKSGPEFLIPDFQSQDFQSQKATQSKTSSPTLSVAFDSKNLEKFWVCSSQIS